MPVKEPNATFALVIALTVVSAAVGCAESTPDEGEGAGRAPAATPAPPDRGPTPRPAARTDTIELEGMPEPIHLTLFRAPDEFPLPFTTYVPDDMEPVVPGDEARAVGVGGGGSVRFVAAFGGQRNPDAFVHLLVFPRGTDRNEAVALARGYTASRGVPVSRGAVPLSSEEAERRMPWAFESFAFRYQSEGQWFLGAVGVGEHDGRLFQIVRHFPGDYADGFGPRAGLVMESWHWADGGRL